MAEPTTLNSCQWRLAVLWLSSATVLLVLLMWQVAAGKFAADGQAAWEWLLPNIVPILAMIGGAIVYQMNHQAEDVTVTGFAFRATFAFSLIYLVMLLATVLLIPIAMRFGDRKPTDWLATMHPVLTALSATVSATLGAFFVSSRPKESSRGDSEPVARG